MEEADDTAEEFCGFLEHMDLQVGANLAFVMTPVLLDQNDAGVRVMVVVCLTLIYALAVITRGAAADGGSEK